MLRELRFVAATFLAATVIYTSGSWPWWSLLLAWLAVLVVMPPLRGGRTHRRPGYIVPPSPVSAGASLGMVERVRTYTSSPTHPGLAWEDMVRRGAQVAQSRTIARGSYISTTGKVFEPGRLTTDADIFGDTAVMHSPAVDAAKIVEVWNVPPPGDCGCGDTAA